SGAMDWYNASVGVLAKQKSTADSSDEISYKPSGNLAELFTNELWYAVESPLDFGDRNLMIMTPEVGNYTDTHENEAAKQVLKLVVLRNKETGETYSFIMAVVPELDYMLRKGDELDKSTYLSPNSDFDGYIFFYTLDGELINGRMYEGGKITGTINSPVEGKKTKIMMAYQMAIRYSWEQTAGGIINGEFKTTEPKTHSEIVYVTVYEDNGIGINNTPPPPTPPTIPSGGGGNSTYTGNNPKLKLTPTPSNKEIKPDKRTDCTDKASQNSQKAQDALGNIGVKSQIESLRINAKTNSATEYGVGISYDPGFGTYSITGGKVWQGTPGTNNTGIGASRYTVFTAHTHYTGLNAAPSCGDVIATVGFYKDARKDGGSYRGTVTFAADGKEYMIYVNDPAALERFYNGLTNNDFYERGGKNGDEFKNGSEWANTYKDVKIYMKDKGYSENDAQSYALSHVLDHYNTGLKISTRQGATDDFKEQKTDTEGTGKNTKYTPKICP
ncbi:MAG: hypothetical protein LBS20_11400, partial [Prevotella sp.]|nr:hypothetical protein [Prevotella sp.]